MRLVLLGSITVDFRDRRIDPRSQAFIQIPSVFAVLERSSLRVRARPGMANAAAKGKHIGRPLTTKEDIPAISHKHVPHTCRKAERQQTGKGMRAVKADGV